MSFSKPTCHSFTHAGKMVTWRVWHVPVALEVIESPHSTKKPLETWLLPWKPENSLSVLICKWGGGADHLSLRSFPVLKCGDFFGKNFLHQVWLNILKDECSLKFVFKFCSWVFLKWTLAERRPVTASGGTTSQGCGWQWVLHDCFLSVFQVLSSIGLVFFFLFFFSLRHFFFPPTFLSSRR